MTDSRFPHAYSSVRATLLGRLREPAPAKIQVLSGPRQVGKTHLLQEIEARCRGRALYAVADAPAAALAGWWETQWQAAARLARAGRPAILLVDEIQYLANWGRRLKVEADRIARERVPLHVVVTGSSSLRLGQGTRETMAGRFEHLRLLHWPPSELVRQFSLSEDEAVRIAVRFGTYPGALQFVGQPERWARYVREAIIEPAIGRDIVAMEVIRRPALLRQLFALAAGHPAEIISLQKLRGQLTDPGALETIAHYLHVLEQAYLVAPVAKYAAREIRRRAAPPKLAVLNQAILGTSAALLPGPDTATLPEGRWIENACIAHAWNAGQTVRYWRQEPFEVDMVLEGSWGKWAVEVKTGAYAERDLAGIFEFMRRFPGFRPLLLCEEGRERIARLAGLEARPWPEFMLSGPPR